MNAERLELPLNTQHDICVYLHHFFSASIILSNECFRPWYYQNYTNLFTFVETDFNGLVGFDFCPPSCWDIISQSYISLQLLKEQEDIFSFIRNRIREKRYISLDLDEYHLPMKHAYQQYRFTHPMLIYGYDDKENELLCIGSGKQDTHDAGVGFFGKYRIAYDTFEKAYTSMIDLASSMPKFPFTFGDPIALFKLKGWSPSGTISEKAENEGDTYLSLFNATCFVEDLQHYIKGTHRVSAPFEMHYKLHASQGSTLVYGTNALDKIIDYLSFHLLERKETVPYPFLHLIFEHKKSIYERLIVFTKVMASDEKMPAFINEYKKLVNLANAIRFKYISYHQQRLMKDAIELIDKIKILKKKETQLLEEIYEYTNSLLKKGNAVGRNVL
jgi:hypothetical protein